MIGNVDAMQPPIVYRTELYPGGAERRFKRQAPNRTPSGVWRAHDRNTSAYLYTCPITKHYVVATRSDTRLVGHKHFVCYQTFQQRAAAVMYVRLTEG